MTVEDRVLATEDRYVAAEIASDEGELERIVHPQFALNRADGTTVAKDAFIEGVLAMSMTGQKVSERTVVVDGGAAVVYGTTELRFRGEGLEPSAQRLRYTATYVLRRESWQLLGLHMSPRGES